MCDAAAVAQGDDVQREDVVQALQVGDGARRRRGWRRGEVGFKLGMPRVWRPASRWRSADAG
jgi:hypothetical protein